VIASLPMYDWPEVRGATDAWWAGIARHLGVEGLLLRQSDYFAAWRAPDLLFSQTCGYPFTHEFRNRLDAICTPHFGVDGCDGPSYCSMIFAREQGPPESFRSARAAVNTPDSMSGMLALKLVFAPFAREGVFFAEAIETGGHVNSMRAVREGRADVCAIDAVCVALARRYLPDYLDGLVEIARSPAVPSLPYVTALGRAAELRPGLAAAFADPHLEAARRSLFISGFSVLPAAAYDRITNLEKAMEEAGGLRLL